MDGACRRFSDWCPSWVYHREGDPEHSPTPASLSVREAEDGFTIDTGVISFRVPKTGRRMIADVQRNGVRLALMAS